MMILSLPSQCLELVLDSLSRDDLLALSTTCKLLNEIIMTRIYRKVYYLPGYRYLNDYTIINNELQLKKFLSVVDKRFEFEFINLSDDELIEVDGVVYDLNRIGSHRRDELYVPFCIDTFRQNLEMDNLEYFRGDTTFKEVKRLSIVVKNTQQLEEFEMILHKVDTKLITDLELIFIDDGGELTIFKTLLLFIKNFELNSLSIMYFCDKDDNKNNLRVLLINSIVMNLELSKLFIYLDLVNVNAAQLYLLYRQLNMFEGYLDFNINLENFIVDFLTLKDINFFKNFIHNSSVVMLIFEELCNINRRVAPLFKKLNSNFKKLEFNYKIDYENNFLYCDYFLKRKFGEKHVKMFEVEYCNNEIQNVVNFNNKLSDTFESDLNDVSSIFTYRE